MEDYKKKYEEARNIAKKNLDAVIEMGDITRLEPEAFKNTIYRMFPELKESEDEKIRKILIHIVKGACDIYGIKYQGLEIGEEKLLAWLEKH